MVLERQQRRKKKHHEQKLSTNNATTESDEDPKPRCLESWHDESGEHLDDNCYQELVHPSNSKGWSADDMFEYNETNHNVISSYNEKTLAKDYTTPLPKAKSKTTERLAAKLAKEIEDRVIAEGRITPESSDDDELFEAERERSISFQQLMTHLNNLKSHRATATQKTTSSKTNDLHKNNRNSFNSTADQATNVSLNTRKSKSASKCASNSSTGTQSNSNGWEAPGAASVSGEEDYDDGDDEKEEDDEDNVNNMIKENEIMHKILASYNGKLNKSKSQSSSATATTGNKLMGSPPTKSNSTTKTTANLAAKLVKEIEVNANVDRARVTKPKPSDNDVMNTLFGVKTEQASFNQLMSKLKNLNGHRQATQDHRFSPSTNHQASVPTSASTMATMSNNNNGIPTCRNTVKSSSQYSNSSATPATASLSSSPTLNDSASFKTVTSSSRNILRTCLT